MNTVRQEVLPFHQVPFKLLWAKRQQLYEKGWHPVFRIFGKLVRVRLPLWITYNLGVAGFWATPFGALLHSAYVKAEVDENGKVIKVLEFQFDQVFRKDGPIDDPLGQATPNAMCVVVEERADGIYVWGIEEWRPGIFDHKTGKQGVKVIGVTGGWAKKVGANPVETALAELASEAGFIIEESSVEEINIHSPNRAYEKNCNVVVMAKFKRQGEISPDDGHDVIQGQLAIRIDKFPTRHDALVNSALRAVEERLGLVSPVPVKTLTDRIAELESKLESI